MVTDNNMLGHFDPVFVTCWVVPHQHLQYKAFCVRPVKKPQDSKASDPLTSPPNAQFYPWPQTNNHNHITQTTRRTQLHCWITSSLWCRTFWDVFQVRFSMVGRRQKHVTSHQDKYPPKIPTMRVALDLQLLQLQMVWGQQADDSLSYASCKWYEYAFWKQNNHHLSLLFYIYRNAALILIPPTTS